MSVENPSLQGITLYSHADDFRSHWIRYILAEKQVKYHSILIDCDDEDLASLNPYNQLPMLIENELKLFQPAIISEYLDDRYRQNKLYADAPMPRAEQRQYIWRIEQDWFKLADALFKHPDTLDENAKQQAKKELFDTLITLSPIFQHYSYFMSENFTILDCALAPLLLRLNSLDVNISPKHSKGLLLYCKRLFNRQSFQQSMTLIEQRKYQDVLKRY